MKLSELVLLKNELDKLSTNQIKISTNLELGNFTHLLNDAVLNEKLSDVAQAFYDFDNRVDQIKLDLKLAIEEAEKPWFQESYQLHENINWGHVDYVLGKYANTHKKVIDLISARLNLYSSWHHAAMIIRPGKENFINQLVSFDPLYVLDTDYDLISPSVNRFNEAYKNRLRQYIIQDIGKDTLLEKLPNEQFVLCVVYMYFDCKPFEILKKYFNEIYCKLKPGGILAFTFNDCDYVGGVKLAEQRFRCYTPGYLVKELVHSIGFEIVYDWHEPDGAITWLELKKPGILKSLKGGQTLAKIVPK